WSGSGATASSIASALAVAVNSDSAAPVSASVGTDGVTITVTAKQGGIIGDYAIASSLSNDGANFATPSFSVSNSGSMMIGGIDEFNRRQYDSGAVSVNVGGFTATAEYGPLPNTGWASEQWSTPASAASTQPTPAPAGGFTAFGNQDSSIPDQMFYVDTRAGHIHQTFSDSAGSHDQDITSLAAAPIGGGPLSGFAWPGSASPEHLFYESGADGHIHELSLISGSWHHQDIMAASGAPAGGSSSTLTSPNFSMTSFLWAKSAMPENVFYETSDEHIHHLWDDTAGWHQEDVSALSGAPAMVSFKDLISCVVPDPHRSENVFYIASDAHFHHIWGDTAGWHHEDITALSGAPNSVAGNPMAGACDPNPKSASYEHVFYLAGADGHFHHIWNDATGWHQEDPFSLSGAAVAQPPIIPGNGTLTAFLDPNSTSPLHLLFTTRFDGSIWHLWNDSAGWHKENDSALSQDSDPSWPINATLVSFLDGPAAHLFIADTHAVSHHIFSGNSTPLLLARAF